MWLVGSRIMQNQGKMDQARLCIERASLDVPQKQLSNCVLEYAKFFEMIGESNRALDIMRSLKSKIKGEWKMQFEGVMMFIRCGKFKEAEEMVLESLKIHFATGRLWAALI